MENIQQYLQYSPLENAIVGRDESAQMEIYNRFAALPNALRTFLVAPETAQTIADWEQVGLFPPSYRTAVAKTIMLTALGEVKIESLEPLFARIGLPQQQATNLARFVGELLEPYLAPSDIQTPDVVLDPEAGETTELREIPPLTATATPEVSTPAESSSSTTAEAEPVPNQPSRNIIDLRKTP